MAVIYVKEQGAYIKKCGKRIQVEKEGKRLADFPVFQVTNVNIIGNVQVTTQTLHFLMQEGVDVSVFSRSGTYIGHMTAAASRNIFLRMEQYDCYRDIEKRLAIARRIVENKVNNQETLIRKFRWKPEEYDRKNDLHEIDRMLDTLKEKKTANEIMGVEGICSAVYFRAYGHMFRCRLEFPGRNRRPPKDPINGLLSLTYPFVTKEAAQAAGCRYCETLEELAGTVKVLSLHMPSLPSTYHMFNRQIFEAMDGVYFINCARGSVVDEEALFAALQEGHVAAAGLDVMEKEPFDLESPLLTLPNVLFTPHVAGVTAQAAERTHALVVDATLSLLDGVAVDNVANPQALSHPRWAALARKRREMER